MKDAGESEGDRRWLEESYYVSICRAINELIGVDHVQFRVYSDDTASSFKLLASVPNVDFRTCASAPVGPTIAFHEMVSADVLAVGLSSFSYLAALLSEGVILIPAQYPHTALPEWVSCNETRSFDERAFKAALRLMGAVNGLVPTFEAV